MHQKKLDDEREKKQENFSRRKESNEKPLKSHVTQDFVPVKKILAAADFFYGALSERSDAEISLARQVAIYLLKKDFEMTFASISCQLKCNPKVVAHAYHKVNSMSAQPGL